MEDFKTKSSTVTKEINQAINMIKKELEKTNSENEAKFKLIANDNDLVKQSII